VSGSDLATLASYVFAFLISKEAIRATRTRRTRVVWRGLRPSHFLLAVPILLLAAVVGISAWLWLPGAWFGWWSLMGNGGGGAINASLTPATADAPAFSKVLPYVMLISLALVLPMAARWEEMRFRLGAESQGTGKRLVVALGFGLAHLIMGIPIAAALAVGAGGWGFAAAYRRAYRRRQSRHDAIMQSSRVHLAYNLIALSGPAILLILI